MLLGHWLEMRSIAQARGALSALAELCCPTPPSGSTATATETVPLAALRVGDIVLVRPGARVPADGVVVEGSADVDESMITGESRAVAKEPGDTVVAGTVAAGGQPARPGHGRRRGDGAVRDHAAGRGRAGLRLAGAGAGRPGCGAAVLRRARRRGRHARRLVGARATRRERSFGPRRSSSSPARTRSGLAIPLVIAISTSLGARNGLLVKDRLALERARESTSSSSTRPERSPRGEPVVVGRRGAAGRASPTCPAAGRGRGGRLRAPAGAGHRRGGQAAGRRDPAGVATSRRCPGAAPAPRVGRPRGARRRTATARRAGPRPPRLRRPRTGRGGRTVLRLVEGARSSASSPSRTRSGPSRPRRSTRSTPWASGWR